MSRIDCNDAVSGPRSHKYAFNTHLITILSLILYHSLCVLCSLAVSNLSWPAHLFLPLSFSSFRFPWSPFLLSPSSPSCMATVSIALTSQYHTSCQCQTMQVPWHLFESDTLWHFHLCWANFNFNRSYLRKTTWRPKKTKARSSNVHFVCTVACCLFCRRVYSSMQAIETPLKQLYHLYLTITLIAHNYLVNAVGWIP